MHMLKNLEKMMKQSKLINNSQGLIVTIKALYKDIGLFVKEYQRKEQFFIRNSFVIDLRENKLIGQECL